MNEMAKIHQRKHEVSEPCTGAWCRKFTTALTLMLAMASGCDRLPCAGDDARCDGDQPMSCSGGHYVAEGDPCKIGCRDLPGAPATCVASPNPISACTEDGSVVCWQGGAVQCQGGYPIGGVCPSGSTCVEVPGCTAVCSLGDDSRCAPTEHDLGGAKALFCDGPDLTYCECGQVVSHDPCSTAGTCNETADGPVCM